MEAPALISCPWIIGIEFEMNTLTTNFEVKVTKIQSITIFGATFRLMFKGCSQNLNL